MKQVQVVLPALIIFIISMIISSCNIRPVTRVQSPDGSVEINFSISDNGVPQYTVAYNSTTVIDTSSLGFTFKDQPGLGENLVVKEAQIDSYRETWEPVWGEKSSIVNHFGELVVKMKEGNEPFREVHLRFRAYNDGIGFRYEFPEQSMMDSVVIAAEHTRFNLTGDHTAWWIPADYDSYEYVYETTLINEIDASKYVSENERPDRRIANFRAVNTPVTMKTGDGLYLSIHEADLTDYAGMTLALRDGFSFESELVPWSDGTKVRTKIPFKTPWRTVQIGNSPADLVESSMILNLNEPNKLEDVSWIEPMKYTGIWWEMHIGKTSWGREELAEGSFGEMGGRTNHGATTENAERYIDFTSEAGIRGMLVEGWNTGWEYWGTDSVGFFDFTTPYPDFDIDEVVTYANEHGVEIVGHHETSGQAAHYETRLEEAFKLYNRLGINAVKTGYAGGIVPAGERHHGQFMVRHYRTVVETAARYNIAIDAHEPIKDTGIRRTYPNMMTREGVRGMEYNAWSSGNPPEHTTILPFTRGLAGPIDYTPGIFNIEFNEYRDSERVHSTLANQLALYVVIYSPLQMVADLPEHYRQNGELHPAFRFIQDVPVDWDESRVLNAEIGDYVTIARKEKGTGNWFIGSVTDEEARELQVALDFLDHGTTYSATIYRDGENADWETNPLSYEIEKMEVDSSSTLGLRLAAGGGTAISIMEK